MINIQSLTFGYSSRKLLFRNLTLTLPVGRIYGLLGKNGAGKSTLLKNIIGLLFPTHGTITVNEHIPSRRKPSFLQSIYFVPEEVYVPSVSVDKYISLFAPFYPQFDRQALSQYLEQLKVAEKGRLNSFSFGQQKKFIIAFALACNTRLLLMDEPTNGLDIPSKTQFRRLISSVMNDDRMIFISTHQIRDLENLIDHVIVVDNGQLIINASLETISEKLHFSTVSEVPTNFEILYQEDGLAGSAIIRENLMNEDSKINLEHLFNGVTENPALAKRIFNQANS